MLLRIPFLSFFPFSGPLSLRWWLFLLCPFWLFSPIVCFNRFVILYSASSYLPWVICCLFLFSAIMLLNSFHPSLQVDTPEQPHTSENTNQNKPYPNCRPMNATHRSPLKLVKQSVGWNNAKEQICNQCTSRLSRYLWFTYESGGIFPTSSAVVRSRFLAGVAIISMQLALLYSELDYLTYNPTSRHGTGYTFTWPRPTVEPVWLR